MIDDFRKTFEKSSKEGKSSNAYLGLILKSKEGVLSLKTLGTGPCHGALSSSNLSKTIPSGSSIEYLLSSVQTLQVDKADALLYFDWLANRSPWKDVFVVKDAQDILDNGWVIDPNFPSNFVLSACIATRFVTECYTDVIVQRFHVYKDILALGFKEEEAFLFSYFFNRSRSTKSYPVSFTPVSTGHSVLEVSAETESYCKNFLLGDPKGALSDTFKSSKGYGTSVNSTWKTPGVASSEALGRWIKALRPKDGMAKKNLNIFHKAPTSGWEIPNAEAFKSIIEQALERIYNAQ